MSRRLKKPKQSPVQLAELMTRGHHLPRFGVELRDLLAELANTGPLLVILW
jgi:hypothetical protein